MRIGVDASRLRPGMSGIGRYTKGILDLLQIELPEAEFILYTPVQYKYGLPSSRWSARVDAHWISSKLPTLAWIHFRLGSLAKEDELDVLWAANTLLPTGLKGVPCVSTVYDLNHVLFPKTMPLLTRFAHKRWFREDALAAARLVAISEGTSSRLQAWLGRPADAIVRPAVPFRGQVPSHEEARERLLGFGVNGPYVLAVGTMEPRKNLVCAVRAVADLKARGYLAEHSLLMVGAQGWGRTLHTGHGQERAPWVRPLGYVDDAILVALYVLADVLIFPSLYEGYGIPVSEALAYGCPVVASDLPELREAGSPDVVYVEPTSEGFASGLLAAFGRPKPTPSLPAHDWKNAAGVMAKLLVDAATASNSR